MGLTIFKILHRDSLWKLINDRIREAYMHSFCKRERALMIFERIRLQDPDPLDTFLPKVKRTDLDNYFKEASGYPWRLLHKHEEDGFSTDAGYIISLSNLTITDSNTGSDFYKSIISKTASAPLYFPEFYLI